MIGQGQAGSAQTVSASATVLHLHQTVPVHMIIDLISLPAIRQLREKQKMFKARYNQDMPLAHFLSSKVLRSLVDDQHRQGSLGSHWLTHSNVIGSPDSDIIEMMTSYIRQRYAVSHDDFSNVLTESVYPLMAVNKEWQFGVKGYHKELHANAGKHFRDLEESLEHLYGNATADELLNWPAMKMGNSKRYGVFELVFLTFGDYKDNYLQLVGHDNLKEMTGYKELFKALHAKSNSYADTSINLDKQEAAGIPPMNIQHLRESASKRLENLLIRRQMNGRYLPCGEQCA